MKKKITKTKTKKKNNTYFLTYEDISTGVLASTTIYAPNFNEMMEIFEKEHNFTHDLEILSVRKMIE